MESDLTTTYSRMPMADLAHEHGMVSEYWAFWTCPQDLILDYFAKNTVILVVFILHFLCKMTMFILKNDNSVVTTCDNLEFHNGINSLSTAMAVLRSRPDPTGPWAQVIQTTLPIDAVVWSIYSPEERSAAWASPTVQQSNMVSLCFAMVLLFVAITDLFGNPERSDSLL